MFKKLALAAVLAAASFGTSVSFSSIASAGEGHVSIGHGVQCRVINGVRVCSSNRP